MENVMENTGNAVKNVLDLDRPDSFEHLMREMVTLGVKYAELEAIKGEDESVDINIDECRLFQRLREAVPEELDEDDVQDARMAVQEIIRMIGRMYTRGSEKMKNSFREGCISEGG